MHESRTGSRGVSRRRVLLATATTGGLALAGCLGDGDDSPADGDEAPENGDDSSENGDSNGDDDLGENGDSGEEEQRPVSGTTIEALAPLDEVIHEYMDQSEIGAGALAVVHDGDVLAERGFGWGDRERTEVVDPDAVYRIGSLSKRFADDAVGRLLETEDLSLDDRVHQYVTVDPPDGLADERFEDVTVRHLLNHEGGWDRFQHANPLFDPLVVRDEFGLDRPPERDDFIRWMLDNPLQFDPGERVEYSNLGYVLLGHVVESVAGQSYQSVLEETVLDSPDIGTVELGRTRPENRHPDEIWYDDREQCPNVFDPNGEGSCADVGMVVEAFEGAGGHVADALSLARVFEALNHVWLDPSLVANADEVGWHEGPPEGPYLGSTRGALAYAGRPTPQTTVVVLLNGRDLDASRWNELAVELAAAYEEVEWP